MADLRIIFYIAVLSLHCSSMASFTLYRQRHLDYSMTCSYRKTYSFPLHDFEPDPMISTSENLPRDEYSFAYSNSFETHFFINGPRQKSQYQAIMKESLNTKFLPNFFSFVATASLDHQPFKPTFHACDQLTKRQETHDQLQQNSAKNRYKYFHTLRAQASQKRFLSDVKIIQSSTKWTVDAEWSEILQASNKNLNVTPSASTKSVSDDQIKVLLRKVNKIYRKVVLNNTDDVKTPDKTYTDSSDTKSPSVAPSPTQSTSLIKDEPKKGLSSNTLSNNAQLDSLSRAKRVDQHTTIAPAVESSVAITTTIPGTPAKLETKVSESNDNKQVESVDLINSVFIKTSTKDTTKVTENAKNMPSSISSDTQDVSSKDQKEKTTPTIVTTYNEAPALDASKKDSEGIVTNAVAKDPQVSSSQVTVRQETTSASSSTNVKPVSFAVPAAASEFGAIYYSWALVGLDYPYACKCSTQKLFEKHIEEPVKFDFNQVSEIPCAYTEDPDYQESTIPMCDVSNA